MMNRIIIVEGIADKLRLISVLNEPVKIICTNGTINNQELEELIADIEEEEVYILTDADKAGEKLRRQVKTALPNVHHLYTRKMYREVATTPIEHLAEVLSKVHFAVKERKGLDRID